MFSYFRQLVNALVFTSAVATPMKQTFEPVFECSIIAVLVISHTVADSLKREANRVRKELANAVFLHCRLA